MNSENKNFKLKIINLFFWLDDKAIILSQFLSPKIEKDRNFLFQIKIIEFSEFIKNSNSPIKTINCYVPKNKDNQFDLEKWN